jgi:predicted dehydrogenase
LSSVPLGLAIVGFGGMGHEHLRKLAEVSELSVKGCFDLKAERQALALSLGLTAYPSFQAVLDDAQVAVVLIATPNDSHRDLAVAALGAGKHVICEKPVALNTAELDDIVAASKRAGRLFMVHQNRRWDEDYLTVKKILDDGTLGRFYHLETRVLGSRGIPGDWRKLERCGGGMMLDWGVHLLDRLVFLIPGRITQVFCKMNYPTGQEVDEGFHLFLTFESGHTALVEVGTCHYQALPLWLVLGTQGTAVIQDWSMSGGIVAKAGGDTDAKPIVAGAGLTKTMAPRTETGELRLPLPKVSSDVREFYRNFVAAAQGKEEPRIKNTEVRRILQLMEAAFESHRTGQVVAFE